MLLRMDGLTKEQARVLNLIIDEQEKNGYTPTVREIAARLGYRSANSAAQHLRLIEMKGYIKRSGGKARAIEVLVRQPRVPNGDTIEVPLVGTIAAGTPITAVENIDGTIALDRNLFNAPDMFCLRIKGDSMMDAGILDGDVAIIQKQAAVDRGEIAAVIIDDEATLKWIVYEGSRVLLRAANPAYGDIALSSEREVNVAGKLIGVLRRY